MIDGFDELNVPRLMNAMYERFDSEFRKKCEELYRLRYKEVFRWITGDDEDVIDELVEMHLAGLLDEPNENTHYIYSLEILRKRDRAVEAVLSLPTKAQKQIEMDKQLRFLMQMDGWYLDFASQGAEIDAMEDAGVKHVERHEMNDSKTCRPCREADGDIYPIDDIPPLTHLRCRRWFTPAD